ncbi:MAG TPA: EamA family transporter, partial [Nonomuraea sp.]|nr:EamA family transporter [Nonomuraea sp.]
LSAAAVGLIGLLNPATGVLLGVVLAGETLTVRQGAGLALALTGILLGQRIVERVRPRPRVAAPPALPD